MNKSIIILFKNGQMSVFLTPTWWMCDFSEKLEVYLASKKLLGCWFVKSSVGSQLFWPFYAMSWTYTIEKKNWQKSHRLIGFCGRCFLSSVWCQLSSVDRFSLCYFSVGFHFLLVTSAVSWIQVDMFCLKLWPAGVTRGWPVCAELPLWLHSDHSHYTTREDALLPACSAAVVATTGNPVWFTLIERELCFS